MQLSDHSELFAVLTELWSLFGQLAIVKPGASLNLPPSDTGFYPANSFHADVALAAGFTPEAVSVMSALPYLHDSLPDMGERAVEIESETFPLSYLDTEEQDQFEDLREIAADPENIMPPSDIRLTWQLENGWEYIYDTEKRLMFVWNPMNDDHDDYLHLQPVPPRLAFQPLIDYFRGLHRLALPERTFVETGQDRAPRMHPHDTTAFYRAETKLWEAMCGLADLYLQCGWDVNAVAQTQFRSSEFLEMRTKYVREVLQPLEVEAYEARQDAKN
jgi:hypothetical protein